MARYIFRLSHVAIRRASVAAGLLLLLSSCGEDQEGETWKAQPRQFAFEYGHSISFGYGGDAERFEIRGWSDMEPGFTWTNAKIATLAFRLPQSRMPVALIAHLGAMLAPPRVTSQPVDVFVEQEKIAHWDVVDERNYRAMIPRKFTVQPETPVFISFYIPNATSPLEIGASGDGRKLGIRMVDLRIIQVPWLNGAEQANLPYPYGKRIKFSAGGNSEPYRVSGWGGTEENFTWTVGHRAALMFNLRHSPHPVLLCIKAGSMIWPPGASCQRVDVLVNGIPVAHWEGIQEDTFAAVIPEEVLRDFENPVLIELLLPDAVSPKELGVGGDERQLGLRVSEMVIAEAPYALLNANDTGN